MSQASSDAARRPNTDGSREARGERGAIIQRDAVEIEREHGRKARILFEAIAENANPFVYHFHDGTTCECALGEAPFSPRGWERRFTEKHYGRTGEDLPPAPGWSKSAIDRVFRRIVGDLHGWLLVLEKGAATPPRDSTGAGHGRRPRMGRGQNVRPSVVRVSNLYAYGLKLAAAPAAITRNQRGDVGRYNYSSSNGDLVVTGNLVNERTKKVAAPRDSSTFDVGRTLVTLYRSIAPAESVEAAEEAARAAEREAGYLAIERAMGSYVAAVRSGGVAMSPEAFFGGGFREYLDRVTVPRSQTPLPVTL